MIKEKLGISFDEVDKKILDLLTQNSRMQLQEMGNKVQLTGQAVRNRVDKLEKMGILKNYTITIDYKKLGYTVNAFISVFMKTTKHSEFVKFISGESAILEAHRTGGEACYMLKVSAVSQEELMRLLDAILEYGNYKVSLSLEQVK
jgi:Lrp/AsnC family leucine-responsive transcriptional regulator